MRNRPVLTKPLYEPMRLHRIPSKRSACCSVSQFVNLTFVNQIAVRALRLQVDQTMVGRF